MRAKAATICHQSFEALPHGDRFVAAVVLPCLLLLAIVLNTLAWTPRSSAFVWSESEPWDATPLELPEISMDIAICVTSECMPPSNVVALDTLHAVLSKCAALEQTRLMCPDCPLSTEHDMERAHACSTPQSMNNVGEIPAA